MLRDPTSTGSPTASIAATAMTSSARSAPTTDSRNTVSYGNSATTAYAATAGTATTMVRADNASRRPSSSGGAATVKQRPISGIANGMFRTPSGISTNTAAAATTPPRVR